jgi:hypothetical protein
MRIRKIALWFFIILGSLILLCMTALEIGPVEMIARAIEDFSAARTSPPPSARDELMDVYHQEFQSSWELLDKRLHPHKGGLASPE